MQFKQLRVTPPPPTPPKKFCFRGSHHLHVSFLSRVKMNTRTFSDSVSSSSLNTGKILYRLTTGNKFQLINNSCLSFVPCPVICTCNPMNSSLFIWPITWHSAMFNSLHSHVQSLCFFFTTKHNVLKRCFQILMWRGVLFFSSVLWRCGLVSRLSHWRSRSFYFAGEARTASVRRSNAIFPADTTFRDCRTGQHSSWPRPGWPVCERPPYFV